MSVPAISQTPATTSASTTASTTADSMIGTLFIQIIMNQFVSKLEKTMNTDPTQPPDPIDTL